MQLGKRGTWDLILLDVMLPKMGGFDVCSELRRAGISTPVILLTARAQEAEKVLGLDSGADDYVTKPFSLRELRARIRAQLRRTSRDSERICRFGECEVDFDRAELRRSGTPVDITPQELRLLSVFLRNRGRVLSRDQLIEAAYSPHDRFINGDRRALSAQQQAGLQIFRGKGNCMACHVGPNFTDERFHNTGVAWREASANSGHEGRFQDEGRFAITGKPEDRGAFKTPTLREIARTAPYMHDGSLATLEDVVEFYDGGGRQNPSIDPEIHPLHLTVEEKQALVVFLKSLSGTIRDGVR